MDKKQSDFVQGVAKALYALGFTQTEILRALGISRSARLVRTLKDAEKEYPNRPIDKAAFAPRLKAFCALYAMGARKQSDEEKRIYTVLHDALRLDRYWSLISDLEEFTRRMATPRSTADVPHCRLVQAVFWETREEYPDYWKHLSEQESVPTSHAELRNDVLDFVGNQCRTRTIYPWPENGGAVVERMLSAIEAGSELGRKRVMIVRLRFGFTGRQTLEEVGNAHNMTRERVRQHEAAILRILRAGVRGDLMREVFMTPLSSLRQPLTPERIEQLFTDMDAKLAAARDAA